MEHVCRRGVWNDGVVAGTQLGASINDVRKNFGFFDPLPPLVCICN